MNRTIGFLAGFLLSMISLGAQAQATGVKLNMDSGFYVGGGLGRSEFREFCSNFGAACDDKDLSWNVFAGYQFNRYWAIEGGYSNFGEATSSGFLVGGAPITVTAETTAFELVGVGSLPLGDAFSIYAKAGIFRYESDGSASGGIVGSASDSGTELTFGLGAQYAFARNLAARLEWQRYFNVGSGAFLGVPKADIGVWRLGARYKF